MSGPGRLRYFHLLTPAEQEASVLRLLANHTPGAVAQLTGMSLERIARIQARDGYFKDAP